MAEYGPANTAKLVGFEAQGRSSDGTMERGILNGGGGKLDDTSWVCNPALFLLSPTC